MGHFLVLIILNKINSQTLNSTLIIIRLLEDCKMIRETQRNFSMVETPHTKDLCIVTWKKPPNFKLSFTIYFQMGVI